MKKYKACPTHTCPHTAKHHKLGRQGSHCRPGCPCTAAAVRAARKRKKAAA